MDHVIESIFKPQKVAVLMLLPECNMTCDFCVIEETFEAISYLDAIELIQDLKKNNYDTLILGGGEPTLWPHDVFKLAEFAKSLGFFVQIGTNATKLPEGFETSPYIDRWILPLESVNFDLHNDIRHFKNRHHQIMLTVLEKLKNENKSIIVSTVVTQKNKDELVLLMEFLKTYQLQGGNIYAWNVYKLLPWGRSGEKNYKELYLEDQIFEDLIAQLKKNVNPLKLTVRRNMYGSDRVDFFSSAHGLVKKMPKKNL